MTRKYTSTGENYISSQPSLNQIPANKKAAQFRKRYIYLHLFLRFTSYISVPYFSLELCKLFRSNAMKNCYVIRDSEFQPNKEHMPSISLNRSLVSLHVKPDFTLKQLCNVCNLGDDTNRLISARRVGNM
jgi:hypothetical protein